MCRSQQGLQSFLLCIIALLYELFRLVDLLDIQFSLVEITAKNTPYIKELLSLEPLVRGTAGFKDISTSMSWGIQVLRMMIPDLSRFTALWRQILAGTASSETQGQAEGSLE